MYKDITISGEALKKTYNELYVLLNLISQGNQDSNGDRSRAIVKKVVYML